MIAPARGHAAKTASSASIADLGGQERVGKAVAMPWENVLLLNHGTTNNTYKAFREPWSFMRTRTRGDNAMMLGTHPVSLEPMAEAAGAEQASQRAQLKLGTDSGGNLEIWGSHNLHRTLNRAARCFTRPTRTPLALFDSVRSKVENQEGFTSRNIHPKAI